MKNPNTQVWFNLKNSFLFFIEHIFEDHAFFLFENANLVVVRSDTDYGWKILKR